MASATHAHAAVAQPVPRTGTRPRKRKRAARARGGVLWIAISGILLTGVVFVNVAVLRLNLSLDSQTSQRAKLRAQNSALQQQLSSELASARIQQRAATVYGLVPAQQVGYVNLAK